MQSILTELDELLNKFLCVMSIELAGLLDEAEKKQGYLLVFVVWCHLDLWNLYEGNVLIM